MTVPSNFTDSMASRAAAPPRAARFFATSSSAVCAIAGAPARNSMPSIAAADRSFVIPRLPQKTCSRLARLLAKAIPNMGPIIGFRWAQTLSGARQAQGRDRTAARRIGQAEIAAILRHEVAHDAEAQACPACSPVARCIAALERAHEPLPIACRDARTMVADRYPHLALVLFQCDGAAACIIDGIADQVLDRAPEGGFRHPDSRIVARQQPYRGVGLRHFLHDAREQRADIHDLCGRSGIAS